MNNYSKMGAFLMCLFASLMMYAQGGAQREKIKTLKVAFITERLNLSSEEAQAFWPVYNEHEQNIQSIRRKERLEIHSRLADMESLSDAEAREVLNDLIALEQEKQDLNVAYIQRISTVISPRKTLLLIKAEEDFKRRLLREMQQRRRNGG